MNLNSESGVTLIELIITTVIASMTMVFIFSAYLLIVKIWNEYHCITDASESAWVLYNVIEQTMAESYEVKKIEKNRWLFYKDRQDSTTLIHENGSLVFVDSKEKIYHDVDLFNLEIENASGEYPIWKCQLGSSHGKKRAEMSWSTFCRVDQRDTSFHTERLPQTKYSQQQSLVFKKENSPLTVYSSLFWDKKN